MEAFTREQLVTNSVKMLLDKVASSEFLHNFQSMKLDVSLLKKLKTTLVRVLLALHDHHTNIELWLVMLQDAVSQANNFFQQFNTQYETLNPFFKKFNGLANYKLQKLIEQLEFLSSGYGFFNSDWNEKIAYSFVDESCIYGRDNDIKKLKNLLLLEDDSYDGDCKLRIISIVGMGGIGKTTLAKLLYNDPEITEKFSVRGWVHVSKDFTVVRVLETILESITKQRINHDSDSNTSYPNFLLARLQQVLSQNFFLLVLDDVWDAKSVDWIYLMDIFNVGEIGSRIIITTRDDRVALSMQTFLSVHYLRPLEIEDCWSIVSRHAFGGCNDEQLSELEEIGSENEQLYDLEKIGREIAKKCDGLPFAAATLGDRLRIKLTQDYWNNVLESDIWQSINYEIQYALQFSYHYLSAPLKRCFAYCSIFPKKSVLERKKVVQLWIAEGLVELPTAQESWEKLGEAYFDVLVSRSLIHQRYIGDEKANFEMHNFIHDLAAMVSSPSFIRLDEHTLHERVQHLSYNRGLYDSFHKFDKLYGLKDLRTFLALPLQKQLPLCLLSNKVVHNLLPTMKQLRVLSLSNYKSITEVPNSIGNLLYLQYLNLSHTRIERLPSEICKLYNLQFLLLSGCRKLTELPEDMGKLVSLRHLDVSDTALREMPVQIAKLQNLQTFSDFVVSKHNDGLKIAELGNFPNLHGKLSISQLQNVNHPFEALQANMKMKEGIHELTLEWDCCSTLSDSQFQSVVLVLEHLRPSSYLKSLIIKGYGGIRFPSWLGDFSFNNMVYLNISNCDECLWLPPLGQLGNLKELIIEAMKSIQTIDTEFYGSDSSSFQSFASLETLRFKDMQEWEEWNLSGGAATKFPSLKTLSLSNCPKLNIANIPDNFPSLTELEIRKCLLLVQPIPSSNHVFMQLMFPLNSLWQLTLDGFPSLFSFPTDGLPKTLKVLNISNCPNLEFLPHEYLHNYTSLEELKISYSCNSMISFTLGAFPVLKSLFIEGCKTLKSILIEKGASQNCLSFLRSIKLWDCAELESFPPGRLVTPNLVYIAVWKCEKLHSLPYAMNTLTNLQEMEIDNLPNLQIFFIDDLPINLRELTVGSVGGIMWNTEPTWEHLTYLSVLRINGDESVNRLMAPLLPVSLVTLCICGFNGKSIDKKWLQHLISLQNLEIVNAPKLKVLPKKGFPSSLSVLSITRCPLLKARLQRKRGTEWRKIAHIPSIIIDDELIT